MEPNYSKFSDLQYCACKEWRFKTKSKKHVEIWLTHKEVNEEKYKYSELLTILLTSDKTLNIKEAKELLEKAFDDFFSNIKSEFKDIKNLKIYIDYKPQNNIINFINYKEKIFKFHTNYYEK